jgi:PD-(D/E)XK nuclease superfamily
MTRMVTSGGKPKAFAWSYSKLKNYETCPKRYYNIDVAKLVKEEESESLQYGNAVHKALAAACSDKEGLPQVFSHLQKWVDRVKSGIIGDISVEQQLAIRSDFSPTTWFGHDVWYRGIADVVKTIGEGDAKVAVVIDWKTGKILEDGIQLALMAACVFAHRPDVQRIRTEFVWLKEDATTRADFSRADLAQVWNGVLPRVAVLESAHKTMDFPPKPGNLCRRWCPVDSCAHHGV